LQEGATTTRIEAVPETDDHPGGVPVWSLATRGDELWIANGNTSVFRVTGGRGSALPVAQKCMNRLAVSGDGHVWAASSDALYVADGGPFERAFVVGTDAAGELAPALCTLDDGRVIALVGRGHGSEWSVLVCSSSGIEEHAITLRAAYPSSLVSAPGGVIWALVNERSVLRVELPRTRSTRMAVRANRDDNRDPRCADLVLALASNLASDLGGWPLDEP
jgi:hypothetical protein